jgi:hypothetical protein
MCKWGINLVLPAVKFQQDNLEKRYRPRRKPLTRIHPKRYCKEVWKSSTRKMPREIGKDGGHCQSGPGGPMKAKNETATTKKDSPKNLTVLDLNLDDGVSILYTPTGEEWRISAVDGEKISFEKLD